MPLVLQGVIAEPLYVVEHDPLHTIAADAVSDQLEHVLRLFDHLRIGEVQVGLAALLDATSSGNGYEQLNLLFLSLWCASLYDVVLEPCDHADPFLG